jgi:hypothetical protein
VSTEDEEYPSVEVVARKRLLETVIDWWDLSVCFSDQ